MERNIKLTVKEVDALVIRVVEMMRHNTFQEICDQLGMKYQRVQQALRRRDLKISFIKHQYKLEANRVEEAA